MTVVLVSRVVQAPLKGTLRKSLPPAAVLPLQAERADKLKAERQRREQHASSPLEGAFSTGHSLVCYVTCGITRLQF